MQGGNPDDFGQGEQCHTAYTPPAIAFLDSDGRILQTNAAWAAQASENSTPFHGAIPGSNYIDLCLRDTSLAKGVANGASRVLQGKQEYFTQACALGTEIAPRWLLVSLSRLQDQGAVTAVVSHEDITERTQAEQHRMELAERLQQIVASTYDGIWLWKQPEGKEYYSERMYTMLGYDRVPEGEAGTFFFSLVHPDDYQEIRHRFKEFTSGRNPTLDVECRIRAADGRWRWIWSRGRIAERDASGFPTLLAGSHTDITDRKELERHLRQSQKLEAIGTLAGGIAHEFNNILAGILGYAELAERELDPGSTPFRDVEQVRLAAYRARTLIRQIVTFSRAGDWERHPLRIQLIVKEALKLLRATLPLKVQIVGNVDDECSPVLCDAAQIHQLIMNLCTNAFQAMGDEGGELSVELKEVDADTFQPRSGSPDRHVRLRVTDNGRGIPAGDIERIFDPFFTTREPGMGAGLGLSMIHGIIHAHGGEIRIDTASGKGSSFDVYLPCVDSEHSVEPDDEHLQLGQGEHIVLVEDEFLLRRLVVRRLSKLGYAVREFADGDAAVAYVSDPNNPVDLVLTDRQMPRMDGVRLAAAINEVRPNVPVVLKTGDVGAINNSNCAEYGFREVIERPVSMQKLSECLRRVLTKAP